MSDEFELGIEDDAPVALLPDVLPAEHGLALVQSLPAGFNLRALLTFLPDVRLKRQADQLAADALAVDVTADGGLVAADVALGPLRESIGEIELAFDGTKVQPGPTSLAYDLHKRLTGLRGDFCAAAAAAVKTVSDRIYQEKRRRDRIAAEAQRAAQEKADREAREAAQRAAEAAKAQGASKAVVQQLKQQAKTATAPPVASPVPAPTLAGTATVANWKCRLTGTAADAEPNPEVDALTAHQQEQVRRILLAVGNGQLPLAVTLGLNWSYLNARAKQEKTTFEMLELQAFDMGGTRAKARR